MQKNLKNQQKVHERDLVHLQQKCEDAECEMAEQKEMVEHLNFENQRILQDYTDLELNFQ
jgi:hypothetical protein